MSGRPGLVGLLRVVPQRQKNAISSGQRQAVASRQIRHFLSQVCKAWQGWGDRVL